LPYIVAAILILRQHKVGYALGFAGGAFWLYTAGFRTTFIRNGFERLFANDWSRSDLLIAVPAALATGGLALFSIAGYARQPKRARDAIVFVVALVLVVAFFIGIYAAFAPRFLGMFRSR